RGKAVLEAKAALLRAVSRVTRKVIFPLPKDERDYVDCIWAVQSLTNIPLDFGSIDLFRTYRLNVDAIRTHYVTGNPVLARFLNDQYIKGVIVGLDEAEALATYLLWEAKEYDLYCGKYSDVFTMKHDGHLNRLTVAELEYWEEHWRQFKASLRILPLLSC